MLLVVARVGVKPGQADALLSALETYVDLVLEKEPGTQFFNVCRDAFKGSDGAESFVILEGYDDQDAYDAHLAMPYRDSHLNGIRSHLRDGSAEQFMRMEPLAFDKNASAK